MHILYEEVNNIPLLKTCKNTCPLLQSIEGRAEIFYGLLRPCFFVDCFFGQYGRFSASLVDTA